MVDDEGVGGAPSDSARWFEADTTLVSTVVWR